MRICDTCATPFESLQSAYCPVCREVNHVEARRQRRDAGDGFKLIPSYCIDCGKRLSQRQGKGRGKKRCEPCRKKNNVRRLQDARAKKDGLKPSDMDAYCPTGCGGMIAEDGNPAVYECVGKNAWGNGCGWTGNLSAYFKRKA